MIKLRLQRKGRKKRPFYHIVVADSRSPRDGRIIERLGRFDNVSENKELTYDEERVIHWLKIGAQPSNTVRNILKKEGVLYKMHLMRWGKTDEEIEAALQQWREARDEPQSDSDVSRRAKQKEALKAEEKAYKEQLEEKAAAAAKELEKKKEAEAKAAEEAEKKPAEAEPEAKTTEDVAEEPAAETAPEPEEEKEETVAEEVKTEEPAAEEEVKAEEETAEEPAEEKAETAPEAEKEEKKEAKAEEETPAPAEEEKTEEKAAAAEKKDNAEASATVSTDMNANEAIDHIKNTPLEELKDFISEDEERVTVQRAWESKQEE